METCVLTATESLAYPLSDPPMKAAFVTATEILAEALAVAEDLVEAGCICQVMVQLQSMS